jgi:uncharacterized coiled-coil DUF342 family protein
MLRTALSLLVAVAFALNVAAAEPKKPEARPEPPKAEAKKAQPAESPQAKRLAAMREQMAATKAKLGEAFNEARKLREQANAAEAKAHALKRDLEMMEKGLAETMARGEVEAKEAAVKKAAFEKSQADAAKWAEVTKKLHDLERQLRDLSAKVESHSPKKPGQPAKPAAKCEPQKPAEKNPPPKPQKPAEAKK